MTGASHMDRSLLADVKETILMLCADRGGVYRFFDQQGAGSCWFPDLRILVTSPYTLTEVCYGALLRSRHERPADGADPSTPPESILITMRTV